MMNSVTGAPVNCSMNLRINQTAMVRTRPPMAQVRVERAEAVVFGSPPAKMILNPPTMNIMKKAMPAIVVRIFIMF